MRLKYFCRLFVIVINSRYTCKQRLASWTRQLSAACKCRAVSAIKVRPFRCLSVNRRLRGELSRGYPSALNQLSVTE